MDAGVETEERRSLSWARLRLPLVLTAAAVAIFGGVVSLLLDLWDIRTEIARLGLLVSGDRQGGGVVGSLVVMVPVLLLVVVGVACAVLAGLLRDAELARAQIEDAIESLSEGVILFDEEGRLVLANRRYRDLYPRLVPVLRPGVSAAEIAWYGAHVGQYPDQANGPPVVEGRASRVLEPGGTWEQVLKDGRVVRVSESRTRRGGVVSTRTDITDIRSAEQLLRQRLAAIEAATDGIAILDSEGYIQSANPAFVRLYACEEGAFLVGTRWRPLADTGTPFAIAVEDVLRRTGRWQGELTESRHDGEMATHEVALTGLEGGGMVAVVRNVTSRRRLESERAQLEAQFHQAQKMDALGRLAGGIAHDFNNILSIVVGYAVLLAEDLPEGSQEQDHARQIAKAGDRARSLVRQILAFSRSHPVERETIDVRGVVDESVQLLRATIPASIAVDTELPGRPVPVVANATQLSQIIVNLCVNARDAVEGDHGRVQVRLGIVTGREDRSGGMPAVWVHALQAGRRYAEIQVRDDGVGMDRAVMERMFEPFYTTKEPGRGTGLGLAAVHGIVTAHGGAIRVESEPEAGTSISVFLPLADDAAEGPVQELPDAAPGRGERIMVVDDEAALAEITGEVLRRLGYVVDVHIDPRAALNALIATPERWRVVVTDQAMPGLTGLDIARAAARVRPELPIIICTGFNEMIGEDGGVTVVIKPVEISALAGVIRRALDGVDVQAARTREVSWSGEPV